MDKITIRDMRVRCIVGILPKERITPQDVLISLSIGVDLIPAARSGKLYHTIDYAILCEQLRKLLVEGRYRLLETMAENIARHVLGFKGSNEVCVKVRKPAAVTDARDAGVEIARNTQSYK